MADSNIGGASLTRAELREEFDRFRDEMHGELRHYATKADVANLKPGWSVFCWSSCSMWLERPGPSSLS